MSPMLAMHADPEAGKSPDSVFAWTGIAVTVKAANFT